MDFSSFLTSLGTSFAIFVILMLLFIWLSRRPGNTVVYYPNRILKGLDPWDGGAPGSRNPFAWIREAVSSSEQDVISMSGVDTAVYFVFLLTALGIFVVAGIALLPVLLPIAATERGVVSTNTTSNGTFNDLDKLSMGHVMENSKRLWAFLIATYWVSFVAYYLLWKAYNHVSKLRAAALMAPEVKVEQFAVILRDIPPTIEGQTRKEQVDSYFKAIYPETFYRSMVITNNKTLKKIWDELEGYKKKRAHAEAVYAESKTAGKPEGDEPMTRTGFLGVLGRKVSTIEYCNEKIGELIPKLEAEQKVTLREKQECAAVVFFNNQVAAASAAQCLHSCMDDHWTVIAAPEPRQLIWDNLAIKLFVRHVRQKCIVYVLVAFTIVFYMIPIGLISAFTTLDKLTKLLPFIKPVVKIKVIRTLLEAYLPQLVLIVFLALLPMLLMFLSKFEGIPSESHVVRAASGKYFYFTILNVFIGVTVGGTLFSIMKTIEEHPNQTIDLLAANLPINATFFLTFVALKLFVGYGVELFRPMPLILYHLKRKYMCKTAAELREAWAPSDFAYATRVPGDMLIFTIVLCYSVIAPLIIPFGVAYFGLGWIVARNQALKVYVPTFESYGRMWPHMHVRMVASLLLYQITMIGYFLAKKFFYAPILIPLPILSLMFVYVCNRKFYRFFSMPALEVASRELKEAPDMERVFMAYVPPCLNPERVDDERFEDALSISRTGSSV